MSDEIKGLDAEAELANTIADEWITSCRRELEHRAATGTTDWLPGGGQCPACKTGIGPHVATGA